MEEFWMQVCAGLANGAIYASLALALVIIFQSTHNINFAQGEMATFSTFLAWFALDRGWPYWGAIASVVVFSFVLGIFVQRVFVRPVERKSPLANVVVFIGLMLMFNGLSGWFWEAALYLERQAHEIDDVDSATAARMEMWLRENTGRRAS